MKCSICHQDCGPDNMPGNPEVTHAACAYFHPDMVASRAVTRLKFVESRRTREFTPEEHAALLALVDDTPTPDDGPVFLG